MDVALDNTIRQARYGSRGMFDVGLTVRQPFGVPDTEITEVRAWTSDDAGATWTEHTVRPTPPGDYTFSGQRGTSGEGVSLRIEARDADGNVIEQEVIDAFKRP